MPKLPVVSAKETIAAFGRLGYVRTRQTGSHVMLRLEGPARRRLVVPNHKTLAPGTLRAIIRAAGISVDEFVELLKK